MGPSRSPAVPDLRLHGLRFRLAVQIIDRYVRARLRQRDGNGPPDPAARSGDQRGSSMQWIHPHKLLVCTLRTSPRTVRSLQSPKGRSVVR